MIFDLRSALVIQLLLLTSTSKGSDIEDFKSFLPSDNERGTYEKGIPNSPYMSFTQYGNNFFFKPNFDLGPKYQKHHFNSPNYKETIPMEPLTTYVEADLKKVLKYPNVPVPPLENPKLSEPVQRQPSAEIIPIAKMGEDTQVILGHAEPLPVLKGSLNVRELLPILYQFFQPYLQNAQANEQKQRSVPYIKPQRSQEKRNHRRICGPMCRPQLNTIEELLMRETYGQMPDGGYIPYL
ncbi:unnamed protein product [Pieris macdunnoughi]|uniref:Uncharacterized protein n=1 Tax=Pieris macdunnoughi TaxID=345717 RepID=A0A821N2Z6_9NEOP|nr:unnamed protein product [Pieris macdunnoughi]